MIVKIIKPLGLCWFMKKKDNSQVVCTTFLCSAQNYDIDLTQNVGDENITEYRWVTKDEFLSDDYEVGHESMKELFDLL